MYKRQDSTLTLWWVFIVAAAIIGGLTMFLILFASLKFRRRSDELPSQQQYHVPLEVIYTAIPVLVVIGLFAVSVVTQVDVNALSDDPDVVVDVIGYQWQWEFRYPEEGARSTAAGQDPAVLVLPVDSTAVSYTHLRAHETVLDLVCRLLLEKKKKKERHITITKDTNQTTEITDKHK